MSRTTYASSSTESTTTSCSESETLAHAPWTRATDKIGAEHYERADDRRDYRNGTRQRTWETRVGPVELRIPCCATAATSRSFLEASQAQREGAVERRAGGVHQRRQHRGRSRTAGYGLESFDKSRVSRACEVLASRPRRQPPARPAMPATGRRGGGTGTSGAAASSSALRPCRRLRRARRRLPEPWHRCLRM
ncbi:MAG: transposase [Myxococcales bacterium]|nr:transposase [Myxococcales bacterium]